MLALPRALVSQNRRRYQLNGYDLDLCYLHPRVIVMGFPAAGWESLYRNSRRQVQRFLTENHGEHFKVYNFCSETGRKYAATEFDGRVEYFPIEDHNVPTFHQILLFCEDAGSWLDANLSHVAVLHCKAGKGRAGMMACMLLLRMKFALSASAAIECYNRERVHDRRGLTVISQKKWVHYCERLLQSTTQAPFEQLAQSSGFVVQELTIRNAPTGVRPPFLRLRIFVLDQATAKKRLVHETTGHERFLVHTHVQGCVQLEFRRVGCAKCITKKHIRVWFNTMFTPPDPMTGMVIFERSEMDWVTRDRKMRQFPAAYDLEMQVRVA